MTGIKNPKVERLGRAALPDPVPVTYDDLLSGRYHYRRVQVEGVVRSARMQPHTGDPILTLAIGPRKIDLEFVVAGVSNLPPLVDAKVTVAGLAAGAINARHQLRSPNLLVSRMEDLRVDYRPPGDPFDLPIVSSASLLNFQPAGTTGHRVRVRGVATHQQAGEALFLRDAGNGLLVRTRQTGAVTPGDVVEAIGFPAMGRFSAYLEDAEFRVVSHGPPPRAAQAVIEQVMAGSRDADLVSIEGRVLEIVSSATETIVVLGSQGTVFRARLPKPLHNLQNGARVRLTGVCLIQESTLESASRFRANPLSVELLLRSEQDVVVASRPSPLTSERLAAAAGVLLALALLAFVWVALLRRRIAEQAEVIREKARREAALEERHRMAREMHDTLAQSFSGLGFQLDALKTRLPNDAEPARVQLEVARQMVHHGQEDFRRSLMNLRAQELERGGLEQILPEFAAQVTAGTNINVHCDIQPLPRLLDEQIQTNILRISQESLANAARHAKPNKIELSLSCERGVLRLRVSDDGIGYDPKAALQNGHFGIRGIYERAQQIRAKVDIQSEAGCGTVLTVTVPC
jgi:signal transduction histidine kinase